MAAIKKEKAVLEKLKLELGPAEETVADDVFITEAPNGGISPKIKREKS